MATPGDTPDKVTYFAETDYRSKRIKFGIRDEDRARHMYIIGKTGMGKSTLLENLAIQDIQNGEGLCFIDPHGGTAEALLSYVPEHRIKDVIYFAPFDLEHPVALNVLEDIGADKRGLVASGLMGAFKKVWVDAWSARMEYLLNNALLALLEFPGSTLLGVNRIFADKNFRAQIVNNVTDPSVKAFWVDEFAKYSDKFATEATAAIQNKVGQFAANPLIRNMVGQPKSTFDIRKVMDERKILIVNLSKGRMGEGNANLVGSMLITKIYLAAMSRADVGADVVKNLPPFYLYVDEFQSFANESFADILSEARKYKLSLTVAHQYIEQMSDEVRAAVFGNVGTMISFRVGAYDAEVLEKEFAPAFTAEDMVNLGFTQIYLKLMINRVGSPPFSATVLNRPKMPAVDFAAETIAASRAQFARPRSAVEDEIRKWHEPVPEPPRDPNAPPETKKFAPGMRPRDGDAPIQARGATAAYAPVATPKVWTQQGVIVQPPPQEEINGVKKDAGEPALYVPAQRELRDERVMVEPRVIIKDEREEIPRTAVESRPQGPVHRPFATELTKLAQITPASSQADTPPQNASNNSGDDRRAHGLEGSEPRMHSNRLHETKSPPSPTFGGDREQARKPGISHSASLNSLKANPKKDKGPSTENLLSLRQVLERAIPPQQEANTESKKSFEGIRSEIKSVEPRTDTPRIKEHENQSPKPFEAKKDGGVHHRVHKTESPRPSLLEDVPTTLPPKEVPLDVLSKLLSD